MPKVVVIIIDGVGVGSTPDAVEYNDVGGNTLCNIAAKIGGLDLPNLQELGLGNIAEILGVKKKSDCAGSFGKMKAQSRGKDSTTGHWEIGGLITNYSFPVYPNGFPKEIIEKFIQLNKLEGILGNKAASGTEIIFELGEEHIRTGFPIVYTSADSVFQIAAHEEVIPVEKLYEICNVTRDKIMTGEHAVGRIIARPFIGEIGNFSRTYRRKDYALEAHGDMIFDLLVQNSIVTIGIGKINDLFAYRNINKQIKTKSNLEGIQETIKTISAEENSYIMTNLVDFDVNFGHRNDAAGFSTALKEFDNHLLDILTALKTNDILMITSDHGNDPTFPGTDHTREFVPLLVYGRNIRRSVDLGIRETFADVSKTICDFYQINNNLSGNSFYSELR
ncbi:MAG: phosphopentomutase [Bacteroidetes bacterium]|nr:phosphopentomutase [Bacteroidota bacterium]